MNNGLFSKALQNALVCAVIMIVVNLLFYLSGFVFYFFGLLAGISTFLIFFTVFSIVMVRWKNQQESVTYGQAFKFGLMLIGCYVVVMMAYELLFMYVIAPDFNQQMIDHVISSMEKMHVPEEKLIDTQNQMEARQQSTIVGILFSAGVRIVISVISLTIIAAFSRKERSMLANPPFPPVNNPSQNTPNQPPLPPTTPPYPPTT